MGGVGPTEVYRKSKVKSRKPNKQITNSYFSSLSFLYLTDIPADDILELFGKTFFEFCQDSGYDKILQVLGATPRDFLQVRNLSNDVHVQSERKINFLFYICL